MEINRRLPRVNPVLYVLIMLFNCSAWVDMNGVWAELPLLVQRLPEYWALPSFIVIITDIQVIWSVLLLIINTKRPGLIPEIPVIYCVISTVFLCCLLLAFFWEDTSIVAGELHSTALLIFVFVMSLMDNIGNVINIQYMFIMPADYMSAFHAGDGLAAVVPSVVALIQGAGEYDCKNISSKDNETFQHSDVYSVSSFGNSSVIIDEKDETVLHQVLRQPLFSVDIFFVIMSVLMATSLLSFALLNHHPFCKNFHNIPEQDKYNSRNKTNGHEQNSVRTDEVEKLQMDMCYEQSQTGPTPDNNVVAMGENDTSVMATTTVAFLMFQFFLQYFLKYGIVYPLQPYSLLPYGPLTYSLGNRLATLSLPISSIVSLFVPTRSVRVITLGTVVGLLSSVYILVLATLSPYPPFKDSIIGTLLVVTAWVVMTSTWGYCRVCISVLMREQGKQNLTAIGAIGPIGVAVGGVLSYVLINVCHLFQDEPPC